ncbi:hypothetical protein [Novosphingobium naphthalenivorans]|uniref:hypothetical protein n=1 Tax=Novosphingobium naphthalenivorans TaxID=273168 RepID=UPI000832E3F4|nr:hypothetical protein [Novosphingobium naphthalenivorans]
MQVAVVNVSWEPASFARRIVGRPQGFNCSSCCFWDAFEQTGGDGAGLCRRFAIAPGFDAWPITESADRCSDWSAVKPRP